MQNSRNVNHGDPVSVTAMADENYKFQSWTDGETANPRTFMAESDVTLQARFVKDSAGFSVILPELEGVTVKPLTGYSTEVKPANSNSICVWRRITTNLSLSCMPIMKN